jgi:hypothetical protein
MVQGKKTLFVDYNRVALISAIMAKGVQATQWEIIEDLYARGYTTREIVAGFRMFVETNNFETRRSDL